MQYTPVHKRFEWYSWITRGKSGAQDVKTVSYAQSKGKIIYHNYTEKKFPCQKNRGIFHNEALYRLTTSRKNF
jgi:hypothetical protein